MDRYARHDTVLFSCEGFLLFVTLYYFKFCLANILQWRPHVKPLHYRQKISSNHVTEIFLNIIVQLLQEEPGRFLFVLTRQLKDLLLVMIMTLFSWFLLSMFGAEQVVYQSLFSQNCCPHVLFIEYHKYHKK